MAWLSMMALFDNSGVQVACLDPCSTNKLISQCLSVCRLLHLQQSICIRSKSTCLMAGDKSSGCVPGQFHRHAVQRRELMGVAHRSQAMTMWTHTCRTAATVSQIHFSISFSVPLWAILHFALEPEVRVV